MNVLRGDLMELAVGGDYEVVVQGCNCFCTYWYDFYK